MDKLQPLIKHRYWICFGFAVMFVLVGWWMASGAISAEIVTQSDLVEKSFKDAEKGRTEPNNFWIEQARTKNGIDDNSYKSASSQLLQRQKDARRWPDVLANDLKGIAYRSDVKDSTTRGRWASIYRREIDRLLSIVQPYKDGEGLVIVDTSRITHKPFDSWRTAYPSSTEIWDSQEDIWLLQSLLTSIARVNEGATRISESQVREIYKLNLRGGDRDAKPVSSGGGAGLGGLGGGMPGMPGMSMGPAGAMGGGGGGGAGGGSYPGQEFEGSAGTDILSEEFGAAGGGGAGGGGMMGMGAMGMGASGMSMGPGMSSPGIGGNASAKEEKRYVDDGADLGYKTRAFLLDVLVRDDQIPNLLASLTNSDFPVEIVRVEIESQYLPTSQSRNVAGMGNMGGGGSGGTMSPEAGMGMAGGGPGAGGRMSSPGGGMGNNMAGSSLMSPGGAQDMGAMPGMTPGMPGGNSLPGGTGASGIGTKGMETYQAAMSDPLLMTVRIGGLLTLYQSAQEAESEAATAEIDQAAAPAPAAPGELVPEDTADPNMTDTSENPEGTDPAAIGTPADATNPAGETPVDEGAAVTPPVPEPGGTPASESDPETVPGSDPAPTEEKTAPDQPAPQPTVEPTSPSGNE